MYWSEILLEGIMQIKANSQKPESSPALLHKIRLITDEDSDLLKAVRDEYKLIDEKSNLIEKATCTLATAILIQERLYFGMSRRTFRRLLQNDPNHKELVKFDNNEWAKLLAAFYNQMGMIELVQKGSTLTVSIYRVVQKDIVAALLASGVDHAEQKAEALEFTNKRFKKPV